ncbi:hypothetical protein G786_02924 [Escherichia coli HVH 126 (4-6034225)]|nr:hypothetical protein G786_02924 [Escherichia coli HVH 126 (4-6034225)]
MPFARYFCIFINVGLGEASKLNVGMPEKRPPDMPLSTGMRCNGESFFAEEDGQMAKAYTVNIWRAVGVEVIPGCDYGRTGYSRCSVPSTTLPSVVPNNVLVVIPSGSTSAYGAKFTDTAGFEATRGNIIASNGRDHSILFKVAITLIAARPRDIRVNSIVIGG